jgi:hypothetical protein
MGGLIGNGMDGENSASLVVKTPLVVAKTQVSLNKPLKSKSVERCGIVIKL